MKITCDSNTEEYLREIIAIHARRMILEHVRFWWLDRPLMIVFAGLIKAQKIKLPTETRDQAQAIAEFCLETCLMVKIDSILFYIRPNKTEILEVYVTLERLERNLLVA